MDISNYLISRTGMIVKIDVAMIGRMSAGWARGRFRYADPSQIKPTTHELPLGIVIHYTIGVALAAIFVFGWNQLIGGVISPLWALAYGFATTVVSEFFVYPSMGLGVCGRRSPESVKAFLSPLANHLFFGTGMAVAVAIV
jgi:hypothetical protein